MWDQRNHVIQLVIECRLWSGLSCDTEERTAEQTTICPRYSAKENESDSKSLKRVQLKKNKKNQHH